MCRETWILLLVSCWTANPPRTPIGNQSSTKRSVPDCHENERRNQAAPSTAQLGTTTAIVDVDDRCPALPVECMDGFDYQDTDGCPDPPPPEIVFPIDSAVVPPASSALFDQVTKDARHLAKGVRLIVIGDAWPRERAGLARLRADAVVEALVCRGADRAILDASTDGLPENYEGRDPAPNRAVIMTKGCK